VPYGLAVWVVTARRQRDLAAARQSTRYRAAWRWALPAALWVAFLPNAFYIMTDFNHLLKWRPFPLMYDIVMIFAFAWTGLLLGVTSLYLMQNLVRAALGRAAAATLVVGVTLLCGAGVYLGRFLRWNSWDLLTRPGQLLAELAETMSDPSEHSHALGHTAVFATVALLSHLTFLAMRDGKVE
jgi:uncharacterized membrane protein